MKLLQLTLLGIVVVLVQPLPQRANPQGSSYTKLSADQVRQLQNRGYASTIGTSQFRPTVAYAEEEEEYEDNTPESTQDRQPTYANQNYPIQARTTIAKGYPTSSKPDRRTPSPQFRRGEAIGETTNKLEEEKEEEEPDRLSILLPQSQFNCNGKNTGYYADEQLGCEVFHYCQDNAKHSWICPEGFTFHQVHLICMPPGGDNICEKSSDYHFVNEFLYKPLNLEEHQSRPNITLRYSDRYFPEIYRQRYNDEEDEEPRQPIHHQHSIRVQQPRAQVHSTTFRPQTSANQVFRSPEEINISLQQRRPIQYSTAKYNVDY